MYDYSSPYGESCYRLMARTGQFIYLRTRGYLDIDRDSNQVRSFVCHNALVDEEEGKKLVREMKKKFAIMIQETEFSTNDATDVPAVENPVQLERAILSLITNLHGNVEQTTVTATQTITHTGTTPRPAPSPNDQHYQSDQESESSRNAKSPPLSIIAPQPNTIKSSITKSVNVIVTASKGSLRFTDNQSPSDSEQESSQQSKQPQNQSQNPLDQQFGLDGDNRELENQSRPSVLQKVIATTQVTVQGNGGDRRTTSVISPPLSGHQVIHQHTTMTMTMTTSTGQGADPLPRGLDFGDLDADMPQIK